MGSSGSGAPALQLADSQARSVSGSSPQLLNGAGGAEPPRKRKLNRKIPSVMSIDSELSASAASRQGANSPCWNMKFSRKLGSEMFTSPSSLASPRRKVTRFSPEEGPSSSLYTPARFCETTNSDCRSSTVVSATPEASPDPIAVARLMVKRSESSSMAAASYTVRVMALVREEPVARSGRSSTMVSPSLVANATPPASASAPAGAGSC